MKPVKNAIYSDITCVENQYKDHELKDDHYAVTYCHQEPFVIIEGSKDIKK